MTAPDHQGNDAEVVELAEKLRQRDEREQMMGARLRQAFLCLEPLVKDLPAAETYLLAPQAVDAWRVLRDEDADSYLVYLSVVRQKCGNMVAQLVANRVGPPGHGSRINRGLLPFFTAAGLWEEYKAPGYLVKRFCEPGAVTSIFGDQGTYKSSITLALGFCVAMGIEFYSIKVRKAGVLIVAGEGWAGMRKRLRALLIANGITAADPLPLIAITEGPANLTSNVEQLRMTILNVEVQLGAPIELLVFDTLAANFGDGEENSATDMSFAIANARRAAPGAAIVVVHHTGHGGDRERGSSSFPFGADFRFQSIYDKASRTVELRNLKQKDDELQASLYFAPRRVGVDWIDVDGEELTAVVLDRVEAPETEPAEPRTRTGASGLGTNQETVLKVLRRLYRTHRKSLQEQGRDPDIASVLLGGLRNAVVDEKLMNRQRYGEAIDGLIERGLVVVDGAHIQIAEGEK